jgi:soluble lytic murein transglycosylase-like protein
MDAMKKLLAFLCVWFLSLGASASPANQDVRALIETCIHAEARRRAIPPELLLAIAKVESGLNWRAVNVNRDGSYDIGVMQINSRHLPRLERLGITREMLWHPCVNVAVGAWILHEFIAIYGMNWTAVAAYNTGNPAKKPEAAKKYAVKVHDKYTRLAGLR